MNVFTQAKRFVCHNPREAGRDALFGGFAVLVVGIASLLAVHSYSFPYGRASAELVEFRDAWVQLEREQKEEEGNPLAGLSFHRIDEEGGAYTYELCDRKNCLFEVARPDDQNILVLTALGDFTFLDGRRQTWYEPGGAARYAFQSVLDYRDRTDQ